MSLIAAARFAIDVLRIVSLARTMYGIICDAGCRLYKRISVSRKAFACGV
jgi:hypothetical protein